MNIYFIGNIGSDAGGWYIGADGKIHRVPGWAPEQLTEVTHLLNVLREASQLKTPELAEAITGRVMEMAQRELGEQFGEQLKDGGVIVVGP